MDTVIRPCYFSSPASDPEEVDYFVVFSDPDLTEKLFEGHRTADGTFELMKPERS